MSCARRPGVIHIHIDGAAVGSRHVIAFVIAFRGKNCHIALIDIDGRNVIGCPTFRLVIRIDFEPGPAKGKIETAIQIDGTALAVARDADTGRRPTSSRVIIRLTNHMTVGSVATVNLRRIDTPVFIFAVFIATSCLRQRILFLRIPDRDVAINGQGRVRTFARAHIQNGQAVGKTTAAVDRGNIQITIHRELRIFIHPNAI